MSLPFSCWVVKVLAPYTKILTVSGKIPLRAWPAVAIVDLSDFPVILCAKIQSAWGVIRISILS
jgi:hypothetical protein